MDILGRGYWLITSRSSRVNHKKWRNYCQTLKTIELWTVWNFHNGRLFYMGHLSQQTINHKLIAFLHLIDLHCSPQSYIWNISNVHGSLNLKYNFYKFSGNITFIFLFHISGLTSLLTFYEEYFNLTLTTMCFMWWI